MEETMMSRIMLSKLTTEEKIDIVISRYKKAGKKTFMSRDIGKQLDLLTNTVASKLKQSDRVRYNGRLWEIL